MSQSQSDIGLIGLAVMGQNLALNIADHGFRISVYNRTTDTMDKFVAENPSTPGGLVGCRTLEEFVQSLSRPRKMIILVKAGGPTWTLVEKKGRKTFSRGVLAPKERILAARASVTKTREDPAYARKLEAGRARRAEEQAEYVEDFEGAVRAFLRFAPAFAAVEAGIAKAVTAHATPVGSGTVARTERIPIERRAEAAVMAWLRHQASDYDERDIARVRGERREVRREIAAEHRALLARHRAREAHPARGCVICEAAPVGNVSDPS